MSARTTWRRLVVALAGTLAWATPPAAADTFAHSDAGVDVWIPDGWLVRSSDHALTAAQHDGDAVALLAVVPGRDPLRVVQGVASTRTRERALRLATLPREVSIGGMHAVTAEAAGRVGGRPVTARVVAIRAPARHVLLLIAVVKDGRAMPGELERLLASPRPR